MYWRKVSDVHLPIFMIVVSLAPCSLRAMAPPALSECTPIKSGLMPVVDSCRSCTARLIFVNIALDVT